MEESGVLAGSFFLPTMTALIPKRNVDEIYSPRFVQDERIRWGSLVEHFRHIFHDSPQYIARAPGRLNMIGECVQALY